MYIYYLCVYVSIYIIIEERFLEKYIRNGDTNKEIISKFRDKYGLRAEIRSDLAVQRKIKKIRNTVMLPFVDEYTHKHSAGKPWGNDEIKFLHALMQIESDKVCCGSIYFGINIYIYYNIWIQKI